MVRSEVPIKKSGFLRNHAKKSPTSKSCASKASGNLTMAIEQMYQIALKSTISSAIFHCPKEILIEISKFINVIEPKLKDHCLNTVMPNDTVKRRELAWENVTSKVQDVLFQLMQVVNAEQKSLIQVPSEEVAKPPDVFMKDVVPMDSVTPSNILNHAIRAYAQRRSTEKKVIYKVPHS